MSLKQIYPRVGVGAFILNAQKELLLLLRSKPPEALHWSIPGGKLGFMERIEDAVVREIKEEVGVEIRLKKLICVTNHLVPNENEHWVCPTFLAEIVAGEPVNCEPHIIHQVCWFPLENLPEPLTITTLTAIDAFMHGV
ncbi:MAG TPA: NUDIX domain-containing protein [Ktedonobacteraceae bacterium]|nr:NUDIX domain-containing protein [Ktedonobacteraceae bacterium]